MNNTNELGEAIKQEKDTKVNKRLIAVNMVRTAGCTTAQVATGMEVTQRSVQQWLERFDKYGIEGLRDLPHEGRPPLIPHKVVIKKAIQLCKMGKLNPKKLQRKLRDSHRIKYSLCQLRKILKDYEFSAKHATQTYAHASSKSTCTRWTNNTMDLISRLKRRGFRVVIQDESIFVYDSKNGRKYWSEKGERILVKSTGGHKRRVAYGALADDGLQLFRMYEKFDAITFVEYLEEMRLKWGKVLAITDNAKQHSASVVQEYLSKHGKDVVLHYLPPGSPHLSAIEECWRQAKYATVHSEYYETEDEMWDTVSEYFRTTRFGLDIYRYLERSI